MSIDKTQDKFKFEAFYIVIKYIINSCLILACVVHLLYITYFEFNPVIPEIVVYRKNIEDFEEFPITFKICVEETNNIERYMKVGYAGFNKLYTGKSAYNSTTFGWHGHMQNGSTYAFTEGL